MQIISGIVLFPNLDFLGATWALGFVVHWHTWWLLLCLALLLLGVVSLLHLLGPNPSNAHVISRQKKHHFKIIDYLWSEHL